MSTQQKNIVSATELKSRLQSPNLVVLYTSMADISSGVPEPTPAQLIPNSIFFDFEKVFCDTSSGLPHTMASAEKFQIEAKKRGIDADSYIVVYDSKGLYSSPRVWWMFKAMGHQNIQILNGGLAAWLAEDNPVSDRLLESSRVGNFTAKVEANLFIDAATIVNNLGALNVVDARSSGRFYGTSPEPRVGLRSGHIPGSFNLPFAACLENGKLKSPAEISTLFANLSLRNDQPIVFSCGSGVTACILALAASEVGLRPLSVYDGSWSEWGASTDLPIETS